MKIGIMGGTFEPVHIGHLLLGEFAYEDFSLDEVWFMPNRNPPHKKADYTEEALRHRIKMLELATEDVPHFRVNLYEAQTEEHSYTYSTMRELNRLYPENSFYFILGADSLFAIEEWRCFREIFPSCTILAAMRDDRDIRSMQLQIDYLQKEYNARIRILQAPLVDISSTTIRQRAQQGLSIRYMVPEAVEDYIRKHQLYRKERA